MNIFQAIGKERSNDTILLWLLGVPLALILILMLLGGFKQVLFVIEKAR